MKNQAILSLLLIGTSSAWTPATRDRLAPPSFGTTTGKVSFDPLNLADGPIARPAAALSAPTLAASAATTAAVLSAFPSDAHAATAFAPNALPAAAAAYGHYISLLGIVACIVVERCTIEPNMSEEKEDLVAAADIGLGLWGTLIAYTGYLRTAEYEKGFAFYSHEPVFWLKVAFVGVFGAASFFNTGIIIKRALAKRNGEFVPMGEKLAKRMIQICNAELVALTVIPLTATIMARGVGYSEDIPWQAEAGLAAVIFLGLGFKYIKEALDFEDNHVSIEPVKAATSDQ